MTALAHALRISAIEPTEAFARLSQRDAVCWLDSSLQRAEDGQFSILTCEPRWVFGAKDAVWSVRGGAVAPETGEQGAMEKIERLLASGQCEPSSTAPALPFFGGAVGWLAYDLGRQFETFGGTAKDDLDAPDVWLGWYDAAVVWDHGSGETWMVGTGGPEGLAAIDRLRLALQQPVIPMAASASDRPERCRSNFSRDEYIAGVETVRRGIARGEYYQLNLVQRFECSHPESPVETYLRLRELNPAPFSAFLRTGDTAILSSSPERFLEVTPARAIRTCPIKGTRPRAADPTQDAGQCAELLASEKERAELLMIVDLLRNDLGRVCVPGSVEVPRLHALESFATVHHLVGEVRGRLRDDVGVADLLRAVFPGGSITGAPKVSAMRAIDRLEPHRRGIGMGAIGYFSAHGRIDLNIAIRTIVCRNDVAYVPVGAGIVWDSDPAAEYAETLAKARALFAALRIPEVAP